MKKYFRKIRGYVYGLDKDRFYFWTWNWEDLKASLLVWTFVIILPLLFTYCTVW